MRFKKIVSGLLACAMVVTSAFTGNVTTAKAEGDAAPVPVSTYNFDVSGSDGNPSLGTGVELKSSPNNAAGSPELNDYTEAPKFVAGRSGKAGDYAVDTEGKHGIILPDKQLGENYTVSFWVKPTDISKGKWATSVLFVGRSEASGTAQWVSMCTSNNTGALTCWSLGNDRTGGGITVKQDEWQMLTIVQSGTNAKFYLNGEKKVEQNNYHKGMTEANQYIALGTNHWDGNFYGCYDDVNVYSQALTDEQVFKLFDSRTEEEIFEQSELKVSERFDMIKGGSIKTVEVTLPAGVAKDKMEIKFTSTDPAVAEVDEATGQITAKKVGETEITTTVTLKDSAAAPKTAKTIIAVTEGNGKALAVDFDFENSEGTVVKDKSGNGNDATAHGNVSFADGAMTLQNDGYVDLPLSIMDALDDKEQFTIEVEFTKSSTANNAWLFCFGSKPDKTGVNYMFLSPNFGGNSLRAGIKDATNEKLFETSIQSGIGKSYTVNMVFDQGKIKLYWNGILVQGNAGDVLNSGYSIVNDVITPGCADDILGFIGKSCWSADKNFEGTVSKFKIYNRVMTDQEIQVAFSETFSRIFQQDMKSTILGRNTSESEIRYNLSLPSSYEETPVTWTSSKPEVISTKGIVKNPEAATDVKLTAAVKSGYLEGNAEFNLKVLPVNKTELAAAIEKAKTEKDNPYRSEDSKTQLQKLIAQAEKVTGQTEVDNLVKNIQRAIEKADYSDLYKDPFTQVQGEKLVKASLDVAPNASASVLNDLNGAIPGTVKDIVTVTYKSANEAIATVDAAGNVTGKNIGYALIITTVTAKYDSFALEYYTQVKVDLDLSGVQVSAAATTLAKGKTTNIVVPANINGIAPTVTYRAKGAVSVDASGKVTAKQGGTGTVTVKVSAAGKSITKRVTVNVADITGPTSVKIKKSVNLKVVGIKGKVKWSLDKKGKKLATIKNGKLTAKKKAGKVKVTAKVGNVTMTKTVTIKK